MRSRRRQMARARAAADVAALDPVQLELDRRSCNTKVRYGSVVDAKRALKKTREACGDGHVYECAVCRGFHVTSWSRSDARRIRRVN